MAASAQEIAFETTERNGMNVHILSTEKFKTTTIVVMIEQALSEEHVTKTALLSLVMKRATARFPDTKQLREYLNFLYGAIFDVDVFKKGERQILQLYMEVPNEKYLSAETPLLEEAVRFLGEMLTRPYLENNAFAEKYVTAEKESLRKRIESLIDDKMRYANQRVTEEMCKGEPYALLANGRIEDIAGITGANLYAYFQELIRENPINIFVVGDVDKGQISEYIATHFALQRSRAKALPATQVNKAVAEVREVIERLEVNQGKLNIGCRTSITYRDDDYPALLVFNGVLGGFPHSKLFMNVREKASLAYYAVSRLESHKGILMMMSGIDVTNYEKAVSIIKEQVELVRNGEISESEMNQTKATLANQYRELLDNPRSTIDFAYNGVLSGRERKLQELLREIEQVTVADVKRVAAKLQMDTIYLLRDNKGEAK
ncbi:EF-P 5-aminopentanol modification-associated protein YfmF [Brevibacillus fulvus]|uniref:Zn-dependent peptidase n=1 Tax=Brevibacillus fulvus TaxID=1125967 RepID=A0A939BSC0_9BACL|nr:pitrilysin family protein [Brevibacillus fulvus]MBM7590552.1 putative Zn-dependent peptidase [Brevibacillus fulvus]